MTFTMGMYWCHLISRTISKFVPFADELRRKRERRDDVRLERRAELVDVDAPDDARRARGRVVHEERERGIADGRDDGRARRRGGDVAGDGDEGAGRAGRGGPRERVRPAADADDADAAAAQVRRERRADS